MSCKRKLDNQQDENEKLAADQKKKKKTPVQFIEISDDEEVSASQEIADFDNRVGFFCSFLLSITEAITWKYSGNLSNFANIQKCFVTCKRLWHGCFPLNFQKVFQETLPVDASELQLFFGKVAAPDDCF